MPRKTKFDLDRGAGLQIATASIVRDRPKSTPFVNIKFVNGAGKVYFANVAHADLERFAVNILKALGSKKILSEQELKFVRTQKTRKRPLK